MRNKPLYPKVVETARSVRRTEQGYDFCHLHDFGLRTSAAVREPSYACPPLHASFIEKGAFQGGRMSNPGMFSIYISNTLRSFIRTGYPAAVVEQFNLDRSVKELS